MNIDLKASDPELVEATAALIEKHQREAITIWGSGKEEMSQKYATDSPLHTAEEPTEREIESRCSLA